jgi:hypothetical protein
MGFLHPISVKWCGNKLVLRFFHCFYDFPVRFGNWSYVVGVFSFSFLFPLILLKAIWNKHNISFLKLFLEWFIIIIIQVGSYFGSSLCSLSINSGLLDDLVRAIINDLDVILHGFMLEVIYTCTTASELNIKKAHASRSIV